MSTPLPAGSAAAAVTAGSEPEGVPRSAAVAFGHDGHFHLGLGRYGSSAAVPKGRVERGPAELHLTQPLLRIAPAGA